MASEGVVQRKIWLRIGQRFMARLFRVNTGRAWVSNLGPKGVTRMTDGSVLIQSPRPVPLGFGLPNGDPLVGTADLNGWTPLVVTPEMVGETLPVFTAIETKRPGGRATKEQNHYLAQVTGAGGIAGVASSEAEAEAIILAWINKKTSKLL